MRNAATMRDTQDERPAICTAIDAALDDLFTVNHRFTNSYVAELLGTSGAAVGRWRRINEPTRDQLAALERAIGKPLGYISRLAGYVEDYETDVDVVTTEYAIEHDTRISDTYREILLGVLNQAIVGTRAERRRQAEWSKRKPG